MSIQSGDGVLEILDGTLKVSRLDIQDITGLDVGINTIARNMVLLRDDQTARPSREVVCPHLREFRGTLVTKRRSLREVTSTGP